jgi:hypothetical protein
VEYCKALALGGHSDWRLPNIDELRSLVAYCPQTQPGGACKVTNSCASFSACHDYDQCDCPFVSWEWCYRDPVGADDFCEVAWSTTLCPDKPGTAWTMNFRRASMFPEDKNNANWYARYVRGP